MRRAVVLVVGLVVALLALGHGFARAQTVSDPAAPLPPAVFPELATYRVQLYGDDMATGLVGGLVEAMANEPRVQVQRRIRAIPGVFRANLDDDLKAVEAELTREPIQIAVISFGIADRIPFRTQLGQLAVGSDAWRAEYGRRIDRLVRVFRAKGIAVYWVGLPIMRRADFNDHAQMMDGVMRERALANSVRFVDVLTSFADVDGKYDSHGPDVAGKRSLLRDQDGVHFTTAGYRKLAHFVERELKRDIAQARNDRGVPLAGSEEEQKRIRPLRVASAAPATKPGAATPFAAAAARTSAPDSSVGSGDLRADNARVTLKIGENNGRDETATLDILRPAIPATVVALITRRESTERASLVGDSVMTEVAGGITVISSITPAREGAAGRQRQSPANSLYFRVLVKGERLEPKPGRSDDFPWPREEVLPPGAVPPPLPAKSDSAATAGTSVPRPQPQPRPAPVRAPSAQPKWQPFPLFGQ
jgi:uncharacterized protein